MNADELLERATADFFWVPDDVDVVTRPEITYCHSDRQDVVFNRVVRARPGDADIAELVDEVRAVHRGSMSRWMLNAFSNTPALRNALTDAGYQQTSRCFTYVLRSDAYRRTPPDDVDVREVGSLEDLRTLYDIAHQVFGDRRPLSDRDLEREFGPIHEIGRPDWPLEDNLARAGELLRKAARAAAAELAARD